MPHSSRQRDRSRATSDPAAIWRRILALFGHSVPSQPAPETQAATLPQPRPRTEAVNPPAAPASAAASDRDYRRDAAAHVYALNAGRIYQGPLPPLLHAIGVLQVEIEASGAVRQLRWLRAPRHAPQVVAEIERTVHAAAPFPAPLRLGRVTYTDTWLWDESGRFQLDTLTEGQL
ncbi:hypothetical protein SAMN05428957_10666 [Oryzisolibacter propanilivorax]|uniref:Uncharacterized protein n=1 Tax=Oryzisolibacter propanilivorax TaxID=1527607 RepID=A0A1G9TDM3_9BURK|nr:hypothetical protein [Oryzisolibacter propanilivorax]SDM45811.1 hypothetical protein SAMN05428957_10666 [Oryzisolibacter propanilivorax]